MARAALLIFGVMLVEGCAPPETATFEPTGGAGAATAGAAGSGGAIASGSGNTSASGSSGLGGAGGAGTASGGAAGMGGTSGAAGNGSTPFVPPMPIDCEEWPEPGETVELDATLAVTGVFDGGMKRYVGVGALGGDGQDEDMPAIMRLAPGTVLKNVVIGKPASDGIHCDGTCYLQNVWWEDVGEDAATLDGSDPEQTMTIECAGARHASDKVFQHNGPGTYVLQHIFAEDFNKLYRSCGNCLMQYQRHVSLTDIFAEDGELLVGINQNYDDTADFERITVPSGVAICALFEANDTGGEPDQVESGSDPEHCRYESSDILRP
jgi:pectate lyase